MTPGDRPSWRRPSPGQRLQFLDPLQVTSATVLTEGWVLAGDPKVEGLPVLPFFRAGWRRLYAEQLAASFQLPLPMPVGQQAIVANAHETIQPKCQAFPGKRGGPGAQRPRHRWPDRSDSRTSTRSPCRQARAWPRSVRDRLQRGELIPPVLATTRLPDTPPPSAQPKRIDKRLRTGPAEAIRAGRRPPSSRRAGSAETSLPGSTPDDLLPAIARRPPERLPQTWRRPPGTPCARLASPRGTAARVTSWARPSLSARRFQEKEEERAPNALAIGGLTGLTAGLPRVPLVARPEPGRGRCEIGSNAES